MRIRSARALTPDGVPSSSVATRIGPPGRGRSSSTADGCSGEAAAASTASAAAALAAYSSVTYALSSGTGCSRNVASTISPSVPCEPANSLPRS